MMMIMMLIMMIMTMTIMISDDDNDNCVGRDYYHHDSLKTMLIMADDGYDKY